MLTSGLSIQRPFELLMVEDSETDVLMTRKSLEQIKLAVNLHVVEDGVEGMAFLRRREHYADAPIPDLVVLDLNLPRMDGREVLAQIKQDAELKTIPVVVLTTSHAEEDRRKSYSLHANCYIAKPADFSGFQRVVQEIGRFWFQCVTLPRP